MAYYITTLFSATIILSAREIFLLNLDCMLRCMKQNIKRHKAFYDEHLTGCRGIGVGSEKERYTRGNGESSDEFV